MYEGLTWQILDQGLRLRLAVIFVLLFAIGAVGQDADENRHTEALQKDTQNPVSSLITVPTNNYTNFGIGPFNRNQNILEVEPVIPIGVSKDWNLIIRWITPIVSQPAPGKVNLESVGIEENTPSFLLGQQVQKSGSVFGIGDMSPTFFLSPAKPHKIIWGVGPYFIVPTATSKAIGQGKLSVGPSFVALAQPHHWTLGFLVNNAWSVAGPSSRRAVNQMTLQPFINYNLKKGWYLFTAPILTANWKASNGNIWTIPVGAGAGRIMKLGFQPVKISAEFYGNVEHTVGGSPWGMQLSFALLFPKLTKTEEKEMMEKKLKQMDQEQKKP